MSYCDNIRKSIDFIEEHLAEEITLEKLAERAFISKYHFHRLFRSNTGKTLMEYIRERRLAQAAYELVFSPKTITHIAYSLNFNSHDVFDKAFKRVYGVSPKDYRKNMIMRSSKPTSKECFKMNNIYNLSKSSLSSTDKQECLPVLDIMISLSKKAYKKGLLSLESEIDESSPFLLKKGIDLLLYGMEPLALQEILDTYVLTGDYTGKELLSRVLIKNGILEIQMGEYPWIIREKLSSFFGEDFSKEVNLYLGIDDKDEESRINVFISEIKNLKPYSDATSLLENTFEKLDIRSIQRALREIDIAELAVAIKGASGLTQCKIIEGLPKKSVITLLEINDLIADIGTPQIVDAQNRMIGQIKKLKAEGEIK